MISKLSVNGFRILRHFEWRPGPGVNILVGANSAGKSTVLDAIELVLRGGIRGNRASNVLSPDWFNAENVTSFFMKLEHEGKAAAPEIRIAATFADEPEAAAIRGCYGPDGPKTDLPGLALTIAVPPNMQSEFFTEAVAIAKSSSQKTIPVEYYECVWTNFKGEQIYRHPAFVTCARIDARPAPYSRAVDSYARNIVETELADEDIRDISRKIREAHSKIDDEILSKADVLNLAKRSKLGIQLDRSPRSDWKNTIVITRDGLPFAALGSAEQVLLRCSISLA